ncbi:BREX-1 system adenine-specific DNA-methyltransferase PglX [Marinifilum sp. RC60d5]|uniref:BREX-1 system adenine-specific DNA-methyltransferase PglX n=1 Tax=Marinifilum sp. RC60d5 TaxID=3458414 RepID=UPI00403508D5
MNTKTFAQTARRILMEGVAQKLLYWGFTPEGEVVEEPVSVSGGYSFRGKVIDDATLPALWRKLRSAIGKKGMEVIVEEAAYTWFNRMMALRIMAKNDYEEHQLSYVEGMENTPIILQRARQGEYSFLNATEQERLQKIIGDYNKDTEAFALLLVGYCHNHQTLNSVFGKLDDYTELLLPDNILQESGFLHLLNTTDAISDEEYKKVELIGWLYQFYISERKDEVFASFKKNKKAEAKDIPAATQIFTPNWIVKYMVENTAGKLWLDKNPDSPLKKNMKYLVENDSDGQNEALINDIEDLTLIDPACGSGHILVEGFDLLYQMYMEEYYTPEEAVESILTKNLFGLDIDDRAAQLATFAILLKAAQQYRDIFTKGWMPQVYAMPEAQDFTEQEVLDFLGADGEEYVEELSDALLLMKQAKNLGSVMKLQLSADAQSFIESRFKDLQNNPSTDINVVAVFQKIKVYIPVLLIMTKKYSSVVANPPYMGSGTMNANLKNYVTKNYKNSKSDLCTVFIEALPLYSIIKGKFAFIVPPSWMFLSSFEKLRNQIVTSQSLDSLLHLSRGIFGADFGSVSAVITKCKPKPTQSGVYFRLVERTFQEFYHSHLEKLFLSSKGDISFKYNFKKYTKDSPSIFHSEEGLRIYYPNISQNHFSKLPGSPIAYWVSDKLVSIFEKNETLKSYGKGVKGLDTGKDALFLRLWWEVSLTNTFLNNEETPKWFSYHKGGTFRRWYGNKLFIVNWENNGVDIHSHHNLPLSYRGAPVRAKQYYFEEGIEWSRISSSKIGLRLMSSSIFGGASQAAFLIDNSFNNYFLGLLNTELVSEVLKLLNPTLVFQGGDINRIPIIIENSYRPKIEKLVDEAIQITKSDWDASEFSWDFRKSPLLNGNSTLTVSYNTWHEKVREDFFQLHSNEEEINRIFIDIYGLQEELTPEVRLKDITILQEELDRKQLEQDEKVLRKQGLGISRKDQDLPLVPENYSLPIDKAEVMQQFISYAIGLFMGRYRLDKAGLNIAHPNPTAEELATYTYKHGEVEIDEDAILPLMGNNCNFPDDAILHINGLLDTIWGHEVRTENINFIQECLNKDLDKFLVKDFYKYHCKMYKKKPIYWLFSSKKGAFQVLVYMHRINEFTAEKIRANYLLEHLKQLRGEQTLLQSNESSLNTQEARKLEQLRKDIIECEEYDMELKNIADQQIKIDLDDGVTVNYKKFEKVVAKIK